MDSSVKTFDGEAVEMNDAHLNIDDLKQQHVIRPSVEANPLRREQFRQLESQNEKLRRKFIRTRNEASDANEALYKTRAYSSQLEKQIEDLQKRLKDAVSILFRLRPQRQECSEAEVKKDYQLLKNSIEAWVEKNCETFLDNESYSCNMIKVEGSQCRSHEVYEYESKLKGYFSEKRQWHDGKDLVVITILMRYIFDHIFDASFHPWLSFENATLLRKLEESMDTVEPRRDVKRRNNWRIETALAVFSCNHYEFQRIDNINFLVEDIFSIIRGILPDIETERSKMGHMQSIYQEIVEPALAIAQKVWKENTSPIALDKWSYLYTNTHQILCSSKLWEFKYSTYGGILPGQQAYSLPSFADSLDQFRFINLSAYRKKLKPSTDLATHDQRNNLIYLLDIFPGLYCSRLEDDQYSPRMTIDSPVLLVGFDAPTERSEGNATGV